MQATSSWDHVACPLAHVFAYTSQPIRTLVPLPTQRDWACYEFLEATATWHHCAPPPLGVLGRALVAAAEEAAGGSSSEGGAASNGSSTSRSGDTEGRKRGGRQLAGRLMAQYDAAAAAAAADDGSQEVRLGYWYEGAQKLVAWGCGMQYGACGAYSCLSWCDTWFARVLCGHWYGRCGTAA